MCPQGCRDNRASLERVGTIDEVEDVVGDAMNCSEINYLHGAVHKPSLPASLHVDSLMALDRVSDRFVVRRP